MINIYPQLTKKLVFLFAILIVLTGFHAPENDADTKTINGGELTFTIRTVSAGGNYSPKHVLAIWIENNGDFIKTRKAMANQRKQYLYTWKNASDYNVVDAISGSTLTSHQTHTVSWDCTDLDGNIVPDGEYVVYAEFTDKHAQGPLYSIPFTVGPDAINLTPDDETYFKDIELSFAPLVGIKRNIQDVAVSISPNPGNGIFQIKMNSQHNIEKIDIFAQSGNKIRVNNLADILSNPTTIDVRHLNKGIYFLRLYTKDQVITEKIVIQ